MGNRQTARTSLRERLREKRSLLVVTATGAALVAAGTAGAATVDTLASGPGAAAAQTAPPPAETADARPTPSDAGQDRTDDQARHDRRQALESAVQSVSGTARQEKTDPEPDDGSGGSDLSATGRGGSCEASMYSEPQPTASGERFDPAAMTAAHKSLPMGTMVEVTNPADGASVTVRINDRGPFVAGRCLDLSTASFEQIASASAGVTDVQWQVVD
ncbi:septal ring lytic transglycosylase RlpA family protein [Streptomonospora salina]|uniref:Probable endolytic peptidoglycan transglycosylase RlpA n=1 Tax=Streptomonospora salina TaxID=104205 RepID=A0A841E554_9ACTN|nr:septal ring lytic transglycosylase RlpA family protein [Streptomonospora salina]MBB5996283.1 rare lipoprotein A [Streptomonospora salina]